MNNVESRAVSILDDVLLLMSMPLVLLSKFHCKTTSYDGVMRVEGIRRTGCLCRRTIRLLEFYRTLKLKFI